MLRWGVVFEADISELGAFAATIQEPRCDEVEMLCTPFLADDCKHTCASAWGRGLTPAAGRGGLLSK